MVDCGAQPAATIRHRPSADGPIKRHLHTSFAGLVIGRFRLFARDNGPVLIIILRESPQQGGAGGCAGLPGKAKTGTIQPGRIGVARGDEQHKNPKSDIEIAQAAAMRPIAEVAADKLGIPDEAVSPYGRFKAKISLDYVRALRDRPNGKLILVTAITPTPAGEGKTTTTVGLGDALNHIGKKAILCLREPSLGPCFGMKGGAAGGGYAQVVPMEDINLHFTGDFHAIGAANNLLGAMIDNHIYWGNELGIDPRRVTWRRGIDMNDRALRSIVSSLGGVANGYPREDGFDIVVASEVMAIFCLSTDLQDLRRRLSKIIVGQTRDRKPVRAADLKAPGSMAALLKDAIAPNLVQTLENNPAFIHGGPFANIAHGCNSVIATTTALKLADYVVTEAGFGADLGAEKFFDIKCRKAGLDPAAAVVVTTVRALKMHGGVARDQLRQENVAAVERGFANLARHLRNIAEFGVPAVVSVNRFSNDTAAELGRLKELCAGLGVEAVIADHWARGGEGAADLARAVVGLADSGKAKFRFLYPDEMPLWDKIRTIAQRLYGASDIEADKRIKDQLADFEKQGFGHFPVCIAKTQFSFTTDANVKGAPSGHVLTVREARLSAGAEFVVAICGDIMTMPGLPRAPAANTIEVSDEGRITGLF
jgi:formate--tetrahydrofolate ligase